MTRRRLLYVINCFPNYIEAMIYREVAALRERGYELATVSIRRPDASEVPPEARALAETTHYILPVGVGTFLARHLRAVVRFRALYWRTLWEVVSATHERRRDRLRTLCHFAEAVAILPTVERLRAEHIHAHWAVGATTCAMVLGRLLRLPFTFTAHAYDIWRERLLLPEKLEAADTVVTCTEYNRRHLIAQYGVAAEKIRVVYHGLELGRFRRTSRPLNTEPVILSVGRLVEQKGFTDLVRACGLLRDAGRSLRCEIVGDGPLRAELARLIDELGLGGAVHLRGRIVGDELLDCYTRADVFAMLCVEASDGDRDGIPNTLVEAMAMELPVVSTDYSGVPELVQEGTTGHLVAPGDVAAAAGAIELLLKEPERRHRFGRAGRDRVLSAFAVAASVAQLEAIFGGGVDPDRLLEAVG